MPQNSGISSGSALVAAIKNISGTDIRHHIKEILTCKPFKIQNKQFNTYCINMYGMIPQNVADYVMILHFTVINMKLLKVDYLGSDKARFSHNVAYECSNAIH